MNNIKELADKADAIISGYAFFAKEDTVTVLNLNKDESATVFSKSDELIETSMDDIELSIVRDYLRKAKPYNGRLPCLSIMSTRSAVTTCILRRSATSSAAGSRTATILRTWRC